MKKLIYAVLIMCLFMAGCDNIYPKEINKSVEVCKENDGLKRVELTLDYFRPQCNNGAEFQFTRITK